MGKWWALTGTGGTSSQGFVYANGTMSLLNRGSYSKGSNAYSINSGGAIAGSIDAGPGMDPPYWNACMWTPSGTFDYLGGLPGTTWANQSDAYAISDSGQVVGAAQPTAGGYHAFSWTSAGGMVDLGGFAAGENSYAWDIDSATGHVVGTAQDGNGTSWAVFFDPNNPGNITKLTNMPSVANIFNGGMAINDNDWVVTTGTYLWEPGGGGTVINLKDKISAAGYSVSSMNPRCDINDEGVVALGVYDGSATHAFLYNAVSDTVTALNSVSFAGASLPAGFVLASAGAINDGGVITGWGTNSAGQNHAFLLTPTIAGDANLDGKVDINDLTIVLTNYGETGMGWTRGDFNGDGVVDINDLTIVLAQYGQTAGSPATGMAAVPEPSTIFLAALGAVGLTVYFTWKRR